MLITSSHFSWVVQLYLVFSLCSKRVLQPKESLAPALPLGGLFIKLLSQILFRIEAQLLMQRYSCIVASLLDLNSCQVHLLFEFQAQAWYRHGAKIPSTHHVVLIPQPLSPRSHIWSPLMVNKLWPKLHRLWLHQEHLTPFLRFKETKITYKPQQSGYL